jgi:hypothetical protein
MKQRHPASTHFHERLLTRQYDDIVCSLALKLFTVDTIPSRSRQTTNETSASKLAVTCRHHLDPNPDSTTTHIDHAALVFAQKVEVFVNIGQLGHGRPPP